MPHPYEVVVFDVNETLSDMTPLAGWFEEVGAPAHLAATWFAALLRDGFALSVTGREQAFSRIGAGALRSVLAAAGVEGELDEKLQHVMAATEFEPVLHLARPDNVASAIALGPDPARHLELITRFAKAGYDELYLHQIRPDQDGFLRFYTDEIAYRWRDVTGERHLQRSGRLTGAVDDQH
jgi:hypothetical protein